MIPPAASPTNLWDSDAFLGHQAKQASYQIAALPRKRLVQFVLTLHDTSLDNTVARPRRRPDGCVVEREPSIMWAGQCV